MKAANRFIMALVRQRRFVRGRGRAAGLVLSRLCLLLAGATPMHAQVQDWRTGEEADRLIIKEEDTLYWKANGELFPSNTTTIDTAGLNVSSWRPIASRTPATTPANQARGGIAEWGGRVFWVGSDGWVKRDNGINIVQSPSPARITAGGQIGRSAGFLWWTDEDNAEFPGGRIWRAPYTGGTPELAADYTFSPRAAFLKLFAVGDTRIIVLRDDGVLQSISLSIGPPPFNLRLWSSSNISTGVSAACLRNDVLYWVGFNGAFRSAPVASPLTQTNLGTHTLAVGQRIAELAHGDGRLWYPIYTQTGNTTDFRRRSATAGSTPENVASLNYEVKELRANDRWVCWIKSFTTISRLPVGTAAVTRNLSIVNPSDTSATPSYLEVIQTIQNMRNENPLVADKITHVRAFARIAASNAGETSLRPSPLIVLHGTRGGVRLPGSPLTPSTLTSPPPPLGTAQGARSEVNAGYWFRLPVTWTTEGTIVLAAEVNPSRTLFETNYSDNITTPAQTATFTQKAPIGMKMIPTATHFGTISRYSWIYQEFFDQLEILLPTSDLRFEFCRDFLDEDEVFSHSPFEFTPDDNDDEKVNWGLGWKKIFGSGGTLAEPGGYDHYVAMLPAASRQGVGFSGVAWPGDEVSITVAQSLFFVNPNPDERGTRMDATTEAQEISHNYGLRHVNCGGPSDLNIIHPYPYPEDLLSTTAAGYLGFNPLNNTLIRGDEASDYMSYCSPAWASDHAWKRMFARISTGFGPRNSGGVQCLTGGFVDVDAGTADMRPTWRMGSAEALRAARSLPPVDAAYQLLAWQGGTLKSTIPVRTSDPLADQGHTDGKTFAWLAVPGDLTGVTRLELVTKSSGKSLGQITGGGAAPVVTMDYPVGGEVISGASFTIKWNSSDDGAAPLAHMVRFSHDNGASWHLLTNNYGPSTLTVNTADVPGGNKCRVEVSASDGILSTSKMSGEFIIANKAPEATLFFETARGKLCVPLATATVDCGEVLVLHGEVSDLEDGWLSESDVSWSITGPATRTGTGRLWQPAGLPPGTYLVTLTATDEIGATGSASATLVVRPAYVENATTTPVVDGFADEAAYAADRIAKPLRYPTGALAEVRMVHRGTQLFIAASGLLPGTYADSRFAVGFDMDNSGGNSPAAGDLLVTVHPFGAVRVFGGNGSGWVQEENATDISGAVGGDATRWSVEIAIPDDRFSSWNGRTVRAFIAHLDRTTVFESTAWADAFFLSPAGWSQVVIGPDPEDPTDSDRDGMPDSWELTQFGNLGRTATTDTDGDGQADAIEFIAGTDPRSASARFRALPGTSPGSVSWNSTPGRSYTIWSSPDLTAWSPSASGIPAAIGATTSWTDPAPAAVKTFYRIEAHYCR